ncbi:MAG: biotin--[acetyl-CoA-carboxylase] ligase [Ilumatobacteraceae bacterium]|nr:biotin--[acetyl-CoA-carboxylase] ligase [Ilumatobacteraceae bacterium]
MDTPGATPPNLPPSIGQRVWPDGWLVSVVEETGSTNADLLAAAAQGAPDRTVLVALHQTAGRGRLDRHWEAQPGANLLVSMLFREIPEMPHVLTQRVGLAALAACEQVAGVRPTLKWPNDLLVNDVKLAGILAQAKLGMQPAVVVGIGINVGWAPDGSARLGDDVDPMDVLAAMLEAYDELPADVSTLYHSKLGTLGRNVRIEVPDGVVEGRALDVEADGRLVVLDDCGITHRFAVGDVIHLR